MLLSPWYPYPPDNGSKIRIFNLLRELSTHHEITLLSFVDPEDQPGEESPLRSVCERVRVFPRPTRNGSNLMSLAGYVSPTPRHLVTTHSPQMSQAVQTELREEHYDALVASQRRMAPYAAPISGLPKVWEEVETTVIREASLHERPPLRRLRRELTWAKERAHIRRMVRHFDACTVVSQEEAKHLRAIAPRLPRLVVVPNGVDLNHYKPMVVLPQPDTLVFNGSLTYAPNYDAVKYFLQEIYPQIVAHRPGVRLAITGRTEGVDLSRLHRDEDVTLTGHVRDVRPIVAGSWVCVAPLRIGGGTRLKILEAMALGTPVVATRKGAEGLRVEHAKDILLAEDAGSFASEVIALLEDTALRHRLAVSGRQTVERTYGWRPIGERLDTLLRELVTEARQ